MPILPSINVADLLRILSPNFDLNLKLIDTINLESLIRIDAQIHVHCPLIVLPQGVSVHRADGTMKFSPPSAVLIPQQFSTISSSSLSDIGTVAVAIEDGTDSTMSQSLRLPFRQCAHLQIDQLQWWERGEQVILGSICLVPAIPGKEIQLFFNEGGRQVTALWAITDESGNLDVAPVVADRRQSYKRVASGSSEEISTTKHWKFKRYGIDDCVKVADLNDTIISFGTNIVCGAWLLDHQNVRSGQNDRFLIVIAANS